MAGTTLSEATERAIRREREALQPLIERYQLRAETLSGEKAETAADWFLYLSARASTLDEMLDDFCRSGIYLD